MKRQSLGRGLDALINSGPESTDSSAGLTTIKVEYIKPNEYQPRKFFDKEKLEDLAQSLRENGMIQPIIVTHKDGENYELIAGERRLEAAKLANLVNVPVIIRSVSKQQQLQFAIIENIQREELNGIEEALAYKRLADEFQMTHNQISEIVGKSRVTITNSVRLLSLSKKIQDYIMVGKLTSGHARAILQVDESEREELAKSIIEQTLSVRKAESTAKQIIETKSKKKKKKTKKKDFESLNLEKKLTTKYNLKVTIQNNNNKGQITFHYKNKNELAELLQTFENE